MGVLITNILSFENTKQTKLHKRNRIKHAKNYYTLATIVVVAPSWPIHSV